jgi:Fe-S-cluster containining protein
MTKVFQCRRCGECCFGEGGIFVDTGDIEKISRFLTIAPDVFVSQFCETKNGRVRVIIDSKFYCIFYDIKTGCRIHPVKPRACSLWPFYPAIVRDRENWETAKEACRGINPHASFEDFVTEAKRVEKESL